MPKLHVIYDPTDRLEVHHDAMKGCALKVAILSVPDDLEGADIYAIARKLAEMLLEQVS